MKIFLSSSDSTKDQKIKKELLNHLAPLQDKNIHFWDRDQIPAGTDKRSAIRSHVQKSDIFALLISSDYFQFEEREGELFTAYESLKDNKLRYFLLIKARKCEWDEWERITLIRDNIKHDQSFHEIPEDKNSLSSEFDTRETELVEIVKHLKTICLDLQHEEDLEKVRSLDSLVNKLSIILEDNIISTINLIRSILVNTESLKNIRNLELRYIENHKKYNFNFQNYSLDEWNQENTRIKEDIKVFIGKEIQPKNLKPGWQKIFTNESLGLSDSDHQPDYYFGLFTPADKVIQPEKLNPSEWSAYKRLFIRAQDALAVNRFDEAYQLCLQIRNQIEPESTQLYEYLLLAFFRLETPKKIISDAIDEDGKLLKYIVLFAGRFKDLYHRAKPEDCSKTGEFNIREIAESLTSFLRAYYSKIKGTNILDRQNEKIEHSSKRKVQRCVETALTIYRYVNNNIQLVEIAVNELCGGGKFSWITLEIPEEDEYTDWILKDKEGFNSVNMLHEIIDILREKASKVGSNEKVQLLADNLLASIRLRYEKIRHQFEVQGSSFEVRENLIRLFNLCKVNFIVFDDSSFLEIPIDELSENKTLDWFNLTPDGELVENEESHQHNYRAREDLERMIKKHSAQTSWDEIFQKIKKNTYQKLSETTHRLYQNLELKRDKKPLRATHRKTAAQCVRNWQILFAAYGEQEYALKCLKELTGEVFFFWVNPENKDLANKSETQAVQLDATGILSDLSGKVDTQHNKDLRKRITRNALEKEIRKEYSSIPEKDDNYRNSIIELIQLAKHWYQYHPNPELLLFIYSELVYENKLTWIQVSGDNLINATVNDSFGFDALKEVKSILNKDVLDKSIINMESLRRNIADNRYEEAKYTYNRKINEIRRFNDIEDRQTVKHIIHTLKSCCRINPDEKYLEIPKRELYGKSKIRWYYRIWIFEWAHLDNYEINFDYRRERRELKLLERSIDNKPPTFLPEGVEDTLLNKLGKWETLNEWYRRKRRNDRDYGNDKDDFQNL